MSDARGTEIRVHGMGDHQSLTSLGSGPVLKSRYPHGPDTVAPPKLPEHSLRLLNWSRASRRVAGTPIWFMAMPFSLINVAGHTVDEFEGGRARVRASLSVVIHGISLLVTVLGLIWLMFIAETLLDVIVGGGNDGVLQVVLAIITVGYAAAIVVRGVFVTRQRRSTVIRSEGHSRERAMSAWVIGAHALTALAMGALVQIVRPTLLPMPEDPRFAILTYPRRVTPFESGVTYCEGLISEPANYATFLNPVNSAIVVSMGLAAGLGVLLVLVAVFAKKSQFVACAIALVGAVGLVNSLGGALRLALDWVLAYLDRFAVLSWIDDSAGLRGRQTYIRAYDPGCDPIGGDWLPNTIFGLSAVGVLLLVLSVVVTNLFGRQGARWPAEFNRVEFAKYTHRLVSSMPTRLGPSFLVGVVLWGLVLYYVAVRRAQGGPGSTAFILLTAHGGALVVVLLVFLNGGVRSIGATVADIVGFWPVTWHPLSGRSYRPPVIRGIRADLADITGEIALVGHSQGSILCAWLMRDLPAHLKARVHLFTCGSPLHSLYSTFFPGIINEDFFQEVNDGAPVWRNYWRETDPIATRLHTAQCLEISPLPDPPSGLAEEAPAPTPMPRNPRPGGSPRPLGHSNYWADEKISADIVEVLEAQSARDPVQDI